MDPPYLSSSPSRDPSQRSRLRPLLRRRGVGPPSLPAGAPPGSWPRRRLPHPAAPSPPRPGHAAASPTRLRRRRYSRPRRRLRSDRTGLAGCSSPDPSPWCVLPPRLARNATRLLVRCSLPAAARSWSTWLGSRNMNLSAAAWWRALRASAPSSASSGTARRTAGLGAQRALDVADARQLVGLLPDDPLLLRLGAALLVLGADLRLERPSGHDATPVQKPLRPFFREDRGVTPEPW